MAKYVFIKPYTIRRGAISITSGGATGGTIVKQFSVGDIIEGVLKSRPAGLPNLPPIQTIEIIVNGGKFGISPQLVKEYTDNGSSSSSSQKSDAKNFFTPKNIIIGAVVLFGILKLTRVM